VWHDGRHDFRSCSTHVIGNVHRLFASLVISGLQKDDVVRENVKIITASAVVLFAGWYALGTGTVPMVVTIELFNTIARPFAVSIVVPVSWLGSFIVSVTYLQLAVNTSPKR
jgi:hypothetical protein